MVRPFDEELLKNLHRIILTCPLRLLALNPPFPFPPPLPKRRMIRGRGDDFEESIELESPSGTRLIFRIFGTSLVRGRAREDELRFTVVRPKTVKKVRTGRKGKKGRNGTGGDLREARTGSSPSFWPSKTSRRRDTGHQGPSQARRPHGPAIIEPGKQTGQHQDHHHPRTSRGPRSQKARAARVNVQGVEDTPIRRSRHPLRPRRGSTTLGHIGSARTTSR